MSLPLMMALIFGVTIGLTALIATPFVLDHLRARKLETSGIEATAVVLDIQGTSSRINQQPVVELVLEVQGGAHREPLRGALPVTPVDLQWLSLGARARIRYEADRASPRFILLGQADE